jgi:hypothetical protein
MSKIQKELERKVYQDAADLRSPPRQPNANLCLMDEIQAETKANPPPPLPFWLSFPKGICCCTPGAPHLVFEMWEGIKPNQPCSLRNLCMYIRQSLLRQCAILAGRCAILVHRSPTPSGCIRSSNPETIEDRTPHRGTTVFVILSIAKDPLLPLL